ncbi:unnamed protein product [Heterosigma akashiwo]
MVWWYPKFWKQDTTRQRGQSLRKILHNMRTKGGPFQMYGTVYGTQAVIHVGHPEVAARVLQRTLKQPAYNHFKGFCGEGVFTADGSDWKSKRASVLKSLFKKIQLQKVAPLANQRMDEFNCSLDKSEAEFDFVSRIQHQTLSLIYEFITGEPFDEEAIAQSPAYLKAVSTIRMVILAFSRSIWMFSRHLYYIFSSLAKEEVNAMGPIKEFSSHVLKVASKDSPIGQLRERPSHQHDPTAMLYESITLLFAGQDTSAATLSWTIYLLAKNPAWQDRLHAEVVQEVGSTGPVPEDAIGQLRVVDAVLREALRLYPVAPFVARHLDEDVPLPPLAAEGEGKAGVLPAGATAIVWVYALHHSPEYWGADADEFRPERWLGERSLESAAPHVRGAYLPFAAGPRACVGQPFAHVALRVMLARLARDWRVALAEPPGTRKEMQVGFTVLPEGGLRVRMTRR